MSYETVVHWGMGGTPPIEGNPFELARSSCLHAAEVARDVSIDEARLLDFAANLNADEVRSVAKAPVQAGATARPAGGG